MGGTYRHGFHYRTSEKAMICVSNVRVMPLTFERSYRVLSGLG
jgi:hypothetical protein